MPSKDNQPPERYGGKPAVFATIEASWPQLIGACMQELSFRQARSAPEYFLCIVSDSEERAAEFANMAAELGIRCAVSIGRAANPYLNKWRVLEYLRPAFVDDEQPVLLLDWDVLNTGAAKIPLVTNSIGARRNPANLYAEIISLSPAARALGGSGDLRTSVNGGVLASTPGLLTRCAKRTEFIVTTLREDGVTAPDWKVEQFALSIAVGEIGFTPLDGRWNVTPVSPVDDGDVAFWHYNDSIEPTRRLKQVLACPNAVCELLLELSDRWPRQTEVFRRLYSEALASRTLQRAIERHAVAPAVVC